MKVVFIVESEEQLSCGIVWCEKLVRMGARRLQAVVVGEDRKTLAEHCRRKLNEAFDSIPVTVAQIERDAAAILRHVAPARDKVLLLVYRTDDHDLQRELFEKSVSRSIWVRGQPRSQSSPGQVISALPDHEATIAASERILCATPTGSLIDEFPDDPSLLGEAIGAALESELVDSSNLIVVGADRFGRRDTGYSTGLQLLKASDDCSVALIHGGQTLFELAVTKIYQLATRVAPPMDREARRRLAKELEVGSKPNLEYFGLMSASAMLAAFGLLQDSAAVIIGAMLIAPLMTPIIGAGLALTQGNRPLFQSAVRTILLGFVGALGASTLFGWFVLIFEDPVITDEMWSRCRPSPLDFCVGLVGGIAASYARTRTHLSSALAGAAIAAALVPPIATAGLQIAMGAWNVVDPPGLPIGGPLLLAGINVVTIMIGSSLVLWARGIRIDPAHALRDRWTLRMLALLSLLAMLTLIWIGDPI